tara:strand:+ start:706 stop:1095 length:390 start_codon:yes stop_codon:yes gene_type:complete
MEKKNIEENSNSKISLKKFTKGYSWSIDISEKSIKEDVDEIIKSVKYANEEMLKEFPEKDIEEVDIVDIEVSSKQIAEHPDFSKYMTNQSTREYFVRKFFPDIFKKVVNTSSLNEICNIAKGIYEAEVK